MIKDNIFPQGSGTRQGVTPLLLVNIPVKVLASALMKQKGNKRHAHKSEEKTDVFLFVDDMIIYVEICKKSLRNNK